MPKVLFLASEWLRAQNVFVCPSCSQLVSNSRQASHLHQCPMRSITPVSLQQPVPTPSSDASHNLPTFEEVCQLNHPTLRYIPAKARPAFAKALSSALRDVLLKNTEDAWLKLFMLPKCVLRPPFLEAQREPQSTYSNRISLQNVVE